MKLIDYINEKGISLDITGKDKFEIITNLVAVLSNSIDIISKENIISLLEEREKLSTTGIGNEIAVPHCKSPEVNQLTIVIGRSDSGIDFQSLDGKPVKLFFLLVAPEHSSSEHLKALAKIARLAKKQSIINELLDIKTSKEILTFIEEKETELN